MRVKILTFIFLMALGWSAIAAAEEARPAYPPGGEVGNLGWIVPPSSAGSNGPGIFDQLSPAIFVAKGRIQFDSDVYNGSSWSVQEITWSTKSIGFSGSAYRLKPMSPTMNGGFGGTASVRFDIISVDAGRWVYWMDDYTNYRIALTALPEVSVKADVGQDGVLRPFLGLGPEVLLYVSAPYGITDHPDLEFQYGVAMRLGLEGTRKSWPVAFTLGHQRLMHKDSEMDEHHDGMTFISVSPRRKSR